MHLIRRYEARISDSNIVRGLTETGWEWVNWTDLAKDRNGWLVSGCIQCREFIDKPRHYLVPVNNTKICRRSGGTNPLIPHLRTRRR